MTTSNIFGKILNREYGQQKLPHSFEDDLYIGESLLNKLNLETELEGHTGCVNCLNWSENGNLLASGSDDTKVIIWDAFRHKKLACLQTPHQENIFSVVFLQGSQNIIASGAGDGKVFVHDIIKKESISSFGTNARVKRLALSKHFPSLIFAAYEDGYIREYDLRQPTRTENNFINLNLQCGTSSMECKCIAINPTNPYLMAVGCNDSFLRLYDIRKLKLNGVPSENCVKYFNPAHISGNQEHSHRNLCVTYATFDPKGRELLINLGGEHIYLYDIYTYNKPLKFTAIKTFECVK